MFDIIVKNGEIVDGSGSPSFSGDVGIVGGEIIAIGQLSDNASKIIDARGLIVSPGFIDVHSHSDRVLLINPEAHSKIRQGVTTEIIGNCGNSVFPLEGKAKEVITRDFKRFNISPQWKDFAGYKVGLEKKGIALNVISLVGYRTVRMSVMGYENRPPNKMEMIKIKELITTAMKQGSIGISTGLEYAPECYSTTDELIEIARLVSSLGGIYASHIRGEGRNLISSIEEAIRIGKEADISVQISHHKANGVKNWGKVKKTIEMINNANDSGVKVYADQYPYSACSTTITKKLPNWCMEGGSEEMIKRLKDPVIIEKIKSSILSPGDQEDTFLSCPWDKILLVGLYSKKYKPYQGSTIAQIAEVLDEDPFTTLFGLIIHESEYGISNDNAVYFTMSPKDVEEVLQHDKTMVGSDGYSYANEGLLAGIKCHPRSYGTFPRVISEYVRKLPILSIEKAIMKMSGLPAKRFGISKRGLIKEGFFADIAISDANTMTDTATYENPCQYPKGVHFVLVNGKIVINDSKHTNVLNGKVLTKCAE